MPPSARIPALLIALAAALAVGASEPPSLESLVGGAEFRAMGLDKLTAEEQARLARYLQAQGVAEAKAGPATPAVAAAVAAPVAAAPTPAVAPAAAKARPVVGTVETFGLSQEEVDGEITEVRARVVGEFKGWDGQTVFKLDNGQVWRQSVSGTYRFKAVDPEVIVEKGLLGYKLRLVETRRSVPVRRIK